MKKTFVLSLRIATLLLGTALPFLELSVKTYVNLIATAFVLLIVLLIRGTSGGVLNPFLAFNNDQDKLRVKLGTVGDELLINVGAFIFGFLAGIGLMFIWHALGAA